MAVGMVDSPDEFAGLSFEDALRARWPGAEVFIHQDPVGVVRRGAP
jgi:hypothetical protein